MTDKERDYFFLQRKKKNIKLREIASHIGCSVSLISRFERERINMAEDKMQAYKQYIDEVDNRRHFFW